MSSPNIFETRILPVAPDVIAPDGARVRLLLSLAGGSMAHFELAPGEVSRPVRHRTVEEIWFFLSGQGRMWRRQGDKEEITEVAQHMALTIPLGCAFQFRAHGDSPLTAVAITMPPWPGEDEAMPAEGIWLPTVSYADDSPP